MLAHLAHFELNGKTNRDTKRALGRSTSGEDVGLSSDVDDRMGVDLAVHAKASLTIAYVARQNMDRALR